MKKKQKTRYGQDMNGKTHQTIDPDHGKAESVADNISQGGGPRYIVGIKPDKLAFYGAASNVDSQSQGGYKEEDADNISRIDYENASVGNVGGDFKNFKMPPNANRTAMGFNQGSMSDLDG